MDEIDGFIVLCCRLTEVGIDVKVDVSFGE